MDARIKGFLERGFALQLFSERTPTGKEIFAAWPEDLPGCIAEGGSEDEALERLLAIVPGYLESLLSRGLPLPIPAEPPAMLRASLTFYDEKTGGPLVVNADRTAPGIEKAGLGAFREHKEETGNILPAAS